MGTSHKSNNLQMFVPMQGLVEYISMAMRECNNGKKTVFSIWSTSELYKEDMASPGQDPRVEAG
jgi:hypothetical protein